MVETNDDVRTFLTRVGGPRMMDKLGIGERMLRHAARKGTMPASWYEKACEAAKEAKVKKPPLDLFDFKK
jgi:hypothetical protein